MNLIGRRAMRSTFEIPSGAATSPALDIQSGITWGLSIPSSGFTSTSITIQVASSESGTFAVPKDQYGTLLAAIPVAAGDRITLPAIIAPWPFIKIIGSANEAALRTLTLVQKG